MIKVIWGELSYFRGGPPGMSTATAKRVLEYGVRAPVFYGNLREETGENGFPRIPTASMFCSCRNLRRLRKPPGVYGRM